MKMNTKWLAVLSLAGGIIGFLILQSNLNASGTGDVLVRLGKGLVYGSNALFIVFSLLIFRPQAFFAWKKFAVWFIPLAALLFIVYPNPGSGDLFSPYPEQVYRWVSALYVIISLGIISWASLRH